MSDKPDDVPLEDHPIRRVLIRVFGEARLDRWIDRMEKRYPDLLLGPPDADERCPWLTTSRVQCQERVGHKGLCCTRHSRMEKGTGKWTPYYQHWYGINYEVSR